MGIRRLVWRIRGLFGAGALDRELDAEIASHLSLAAEEYERRGFSPDEALAAARRNFGAIGPLKERYREARGLPRVETALQDLRYACRTLRRTPAVTSVAVVSLALALGATTAVFSVINALLLRALPVGEPQALVSIAARENGGNALLSFPMYRELRERQHVLADILATAGETPVRLTIPATGGGSSDLDNMRVAFVSGNYFDVLGVRPAAGRLFLPSDDRHPQTSETLGSVIVLSDGFWARQFGRDPAVVGRTLLVDRSPCRIVGIAARGFTGEAVGASPVGWVPLVPFTSPDDLDNRRGTFTAFMGRLAPGVTREQASTALTALFQQLLTAERRVTSPVTEFSIALGDASTGIDFALRRTFMRPLLIVMGIVVTVLLIACTNVANLLLARAAARAGEIGVRLALGCSRARLVSQLLTESLLLSLAGAAAGLVLAFWGSQTLLAMVASGPVPIHLDVRPDLRVFAFLLAIATATGVAFGLAPALRGTKLDIAPSLKASVRTGGSRGPRQRLTRTLVACQVALSLLLLVGAGLLIRTLQNLHGLDLGFRPAQVVIFDLAHNPRDRAPSAMAQVAWEVYGRVKQVPGIRSASVSGLLIFSPSDIGSVVNIPGYTARADERVTARFSSVSPGYFDTVGMTILEGRAMDERDTFAAPPVAVINESMARRYFPKGAIGRVMQTGVGRGAVPRKTPAAPDAGSVEIVGVVRDAKYNDLRTDPRPMFYLSIFQAPRSLRSLEVRTDRPIAALAAPIREAIASATSDVMIRRIVALSDQVDQSIAGERLMMKLSSFFGVLALMLACIGLYGVMSYMVTQRTGEIGLRMALGASRGSVVWMVLRQTLLLVAAGILAGVPLAMATGRLVGRFLYGLSPRDPMTLAIAAVLLTAAAALAAYVPARKAARVDPLVALRCE